MKGLKVTLKQNMENNSVKCNVRKIMCIIS